MTHAELSALYSHLSRHADMTQHDTAKHLNWLDNKGRPYRVKVQRVLKALEKLGCIRVAQIKEIGRRHFSRIVYECITPPAPVATDGVIFYKQATKAKADGAVYVRGRVIRTVDGLAHIAYIARVCRDIGNATKA